MKRYVTILLFFLWVLCSVPAQATTYYLATGAAGGDDRNDGLSPGKPWWSPNHEINCGDVIIALPSEFYSQDQFTFGQWGSVNCPSGDNVAWLKCAVFATCKLTATGSSGMWVTSSYWGVQGWEVSTRNGQDVCFEAFPRAENGASIHHIIFANDIANGCYGSGFLPVNWGTAGVDYFAVVGNIAYDAARQSVQCGSGIAIVASKATDSLPGTHIYIAGNYTWGTMNPPVCAGGIPTDGNGIIIDTLDVFSYDQQVVVENNISFLNGGSGFRVVDTTMAPVYFRNNTSFGNSLDPNADATWCGEIVNQVSNKVVMTRNIARTNTATGCGGFPTYGFYIVGADSSSQVDSNLGYSLIGSHYLIDSSPGFLLGGNNAFGTDPNFVDAPNSNPGAPHCDGAAHVADCASDIISRFVARAPEAAGRGYQAPGPPAYDALFPQWLCNVNLPVGLIRMGCATGSAPPSPPAPPTNLELTVQ